MTGIIDPKLIDVFFDEHDGYPDELAAGDTRDALWDMCGDASRDFPEKLWIDPKDWEDVANENDKNGTWPIDYVDRTTNQPPTHECTTHSLRTIFEGARNRQRRIKIGPPQMGKLNPISAKSASVWVSCMSIYAEANPRKWGGASVRGVLEIACRRGFLPDKIQPRDYGFKHTLIGTNGKGNECQSSGKWVSVDDFPEGWKETAKHLKPLEIVFPTEWEHIICLVLHGYGVGVGRGRHAVPYQKWMVKDNVMMYLDSYDRILYDSLRTVKGTVGSAYSIISTTVPDDWDKPAG